MQADGTPLPSNNGTLLNSNGELGGQAEQELPARKTLKQKVNELPTAPPQPSSKQKKKYDLNITGFPQTVNTALLPPRAREETDFSEIDPLCYRKNHPIKNNNAGAYDSQREATAGVHAAGGTSFVTTNQRRERTTQVGFAIREEFQKDPSKVNMNVVVPKGYQPKATRNGSAAVDAAQLKFDERSTYRLDYCDESDLDMNRNGNLNNSAIRDFLDSYQSGWSEEDKYNIQQANKKPYLTQPQAFAERNKNNSRTIYRSTLIPQSDQPDYRTQSHNVDLKQMGTNFAFSGYYHTYKKGGSKQNKDRSATTTNNNNNDDDDEEEEELDDPRRQIHYDKSIARMPGAPHSMIQKTYSPRDSFYFDKQLSTGAGNKQRESATEELRRLRAMRRETFEKSCRAREDYRNSVRSHDYDGNFLDSDIRRAAAPRDGGENAGGADDNNNTTNNNNNNNNNNNSSTRRSIVMPGLKGCGYRRAPGGDKENYVYLPRDTFSHRPIDDW